MKILIKSLIIVLCFGVYNSAYSQTSSGHYGTAGFSDVSFSLGGYNSYMVADWSWSGKTVVAASVTVFAHSDANGDSIIAYMDTDLLPGYKFVDTTVPAYNISEFESVYYDWYIEFDDGTYSGYYADFNSGTEIAIGASY